MKQYGTDLLAACLLLLLLERALSDERRPADWLWLCIVCCVLSFLSFIPVFWFASCVVAASLPDAGPDRAPDRGVWRLRYGRAIVAVLMCAGSLGLQYAAFIKPNLRPEQFQNFRADFVDPAAIGVSLHGLQQTFGLFFIPLSAGLAKYAVWLAEAVMACGVIRAATLLARRNRAACVVLLGARFPSPWQSWSAPPGCTRCFTTRGS